MAANGWRRGLKGVWRAALAVCTLVAAAACQGGASGRPAFEDCATPGDEDGNGLADCADPACSAYPGCAQCGNGRRELDEECDDGNALDGDGCDHNCTLTACGNGVITAGEACDDGNTADGDGCDHDCAVTACGNGVITAGEACDDGNTADGDGCDHNCTPTACGNGVVTAGEACDDGNTVDGDGCDHDCTVTACGNGVVTTGETCDDGNTVDGDGCDAACHFSACPGAAPIEPGHGGAVPLAGNITKLVADPASCLLFALDAASPSHLAVISTVSKRVLAEVTLFEDATDLAVSPNGSYLVISYATNAIGVIDRATMRQSTRVPTFSSPVTVAVTDGGIAFYSDIDVIAHRIDLRDASGDSIGFSSGGDLAVSRDDHSVFIGDWGNVGGELRVFDIAGGTPVLVDRGNGGDGFDYPRRHVYLSPGGQHVYYADHQLAAASLAMTRGSTGESILAEDLAGTFAVGSDHVFDAELVRPVAALPHTAGAATLAAGDRALWYHNLDTRQLYYLSPQELLAGVALGVREVDPAPLDTYRFDRLLHDPVRPRLYGVDPAQATVVVLDEASLQPTRAIRVGSTPHAIVVDAAGTTLFVAHDDTTAFARIRLDTLGFAGFVATPRFPSRLAAVGGNRLVIVARAQFNTPTLVDARSGAVLSQAAMVAGGEVAASADGSTVFLGESNVSPGTMHRYSLATGRLVATQSLFGLEGRLDPVVVVPDGSRVFYAAHALDGRDLTVAPFSFDGPILAVSPDGRRAVSALSVYDVATGSRLGALPLTASAAAFSRDGATAFLSGGGALRAIDVTGL